ncbi:MAG: ferrochelatase [Candidatus Krumholzibacteriia bacterium]
MALMGPDIFPANRLDPAVKTGLILCGMGGPDGPDAVRPFLRNLFKDPLIFPAPRLIAPVLGWAISTFRAPKVRERYRQMNPDCVSPQMETTLMQATELSHLLGGFGFQIIPGIAMRYWRPYPAQTVAEMLGAGAVQFLVVPMYPQYSSATNGSTLAFVQDAIRRHAPTARIHMLSGWGMLPGFLAALARPGIEQLTAWAEAGLPSRECGLVYVAHSLPQRFIDQGDPYLDFTLATVRDVQLRILRALADRGHGPWARQVLGAEAVPSFQSRVGPIEWLGPEVTEAVRLKAQDGCRRLLVQPVSFTCEHIETLIELDDELKQDAEGFGITEFHRGPALNLDHEWLKSMAAMLADQAFAGELHRA